MPRFHFNVLDGVCDIDRVGTELADVNAAWREVRLLASEMLKSENEWKKLGDEWRVEVTDHAGMILFRIDLAATRSPVMGAERPHLVWPPASR